MYYGAFSLGHGGSDPKDPHRGNNVGQSGMATWRRDGVVGYSAGTVTIHDMAELRFLSGIEDEPGGAADGQ